MNTQGRLTTHVLDTAHGRPAAQVLIEVWRLDIRAHLRLLLKVVRTNSDGRTDEPLLTGAALEVGEYEVVFFVGDYFEEIAGPLPTPRFLDRVPVRFGVADATAHYHVPLLVSPWAYSTYRGS